MNPITRITQAEHTITLDPSELSFVAGHIQQYHALYVEASGHLNRVRRQAMEAVDALRGYNSQSSVADELERVVRGEKV